MFCFKCGAEISDESDFCMKCGTEILHHNKTEIEEVNSISTIPMNATIKIGFCVNYNSFGNGDLIQKWAQKRNYKSIRHIRY